jgi:uncharacterized protein (TIGR00290 family)
MSDSKEKIIFSWSGGKDSTLALHEIERSGKFEVVALLTTISTDFDRICMHGVRKSLLMNQVESLGLKLHEIPLAPCPTNVEYEANMERALSHYKEQGIRRVAFGDIFLEDLKEYRDKNLAKLGMEGIYPIWKRDSAKLITTFVDLGFKAVTTCVDTSVLPASFSGRIIDESFVRDLPLGADPCGENGEFHSFVYDGPLFRNEVKFVLGEKHITDRFCFCDLVPLELVRQENV